MADYRLKRNVPRWNVFKRLRILEKIMFEFQNPKIGQIVFEALPEEQKDLFEEIPEKKAEEKTDDTV